MGNSLFRVNEDKVLDLCRPREGIGPVEMLVRFNDGWFKGRETDDRRQHLERLDGRPKIGSRWAPRRWPKKCRCKG